MSNAKIKMIRKSEESLAKLAEYLEQEFSSNLFEPELVANHTECINGVEITLISFEKYYMRNGSMAVLTIQGISCDGNQTLYLIGNGGGEGVMNISWGANRNFAEKAVTALRKIGFIG